MQSCVVKGPSFNGSGLVGGASTVEINDASAYTLTCIALDGSTTTAKVTVDLAL